MRIPIGNSGGGTLSYNASASTTSGGNWLSVTQGGAGATLSTPDPLTVSVDPSSIAVGTYTGQVTITADTTQNIPVPVTVSRVSRIRSVSVRLAPQIGSPGGLRTEGPASEDALAGMRIPYTVIYSPDRLHLRRGETVVVPPFVDDQVLLGLGHSLWWVVGSQRPGLREC